jgi:hypothetical protein
VSVYTHIYMCVYIYIYIYVYIYTHTHTHTIRVFKASYLYQKYSVPHPVPLDKYTIDFPLLRILYSLARPGRKQATATEDSDFHISYL